jgi:hypothetical protein
VVDGVVGEKCRQVGGPDVLAKRYRAKRGESRATREDGPLDNVSESEMLAERVGFVPSAARAARSLKTARADNLSESEMLAERVGFEPSRPLQIQEDTRNPLPCTPNLPGMPWRLVRIGPRGSAQSVVGNRVFH